MEGEIVEGVNESGVIQPLNKTVVHKICTGQVILSLAAACKELIENALDAEATVIEIRAKDYGLVSLEVIDNGCGIKEENFTIFGKAHCTSKLTDFNDLVSLTTFGFRGEALNALMALSDLVVLTRNAESKVGYKLDYDHSGNVTKKLACARQVGTTVIVSNFFSSLPVRRKELEKNVKKEFTKLTNLINAYCLICTNVRFEFSHTLNSKKQTLVVTHGNSTVKENLCNVFGSKQIDVLLEFVTSEPKEDVLMNYNLIPNDIQMDLFRIEGFVSGVQRTDGRSTTDRQYIFINNRPCDYQKICRVINEVYHEYNKNQYPFVLLNIRTKSDVIDVNVTPDKRSIFVANEALLLALLKSSLRSMYDATAGTFDVGESSKITNFFQNDTSRSMKRSNTNHDAVGDENFQPIVKQTKILDKFRAFVSNTQRCKEKINNDVDALSECSSEGNSLKLNVCESRKSVEDEEESFTLNFSRRNNFLLETEELTNRTERGSGEEKIDDASAIPDIELLPLEECKNDYDYFLGKRQDEATQNNSVENFSSKSPLQTRSQVFSGEENNDSAVERYVVDKALTNVYRATYEVSNSSQCLTRRAAEIDNDCISDNNGFNRLFRAKIVPNDNKIAEDELKRSICKDAFKQMNIIGQFNLGFIVVRLAFDLFIVDQHASDEKYNFELLQRNFVVESQRLIQPMTLDLTSANENIVVDNLEVFRKNGFEFEIFNYSPRLKLIATPIYQNDTSGKEDIDDIIFMLTDFPGQMYRPPRFYGVFAMKACRKSVMIGTALSKEQMERIVCHMADIEQPWNCPHGRPTMRHLFNLKMLPDDEYTKKC